ncbi:MAG: acylneuraminate cytidylyltransferase [Thaumarchaeota archaeon]|nr:MAG: acylneuraminate cytidylyltransferase [Nitrososphaerota archaeon]
MKILSIIPVRGGSKGIPMKNIVKLNGKPLLDYTVNASLQSKKITKTIVSTDNQKIANHALKLGAEVIHRPKKLSGDKTAIEPVMIQVLDTLRKKQNFIPDLIVLLQNTSPLRNSKHIDESIQLLLKNKCDSVFSAFKSHCFLWQKISNNCKPINYSPKKRPNRQEMNEQFIENGALFIFTYNSFLKNACRISGKIGIYEMPEELSYQIDSKHDLNLIKSIMENRGMLNAKK